MYSMFVDVASSIKVYKKIHRFWWINIKPPLHITFCLSVKTEDRSVLLKIFLVLDKFLVKTMEVFSNSNSVSSDVGKKVKFYHKIVYMVEKRKANNCKNWIVW